MCKTVYLTAKRFDHPANVFKRALANELRKRGVEVVTDYSQDYLNLFRKRKTYGIALAFDFYRDEKQGCGLTLNKNSTCINREFAYTLSNVYDILTPSLRWRDFQFVDTEDKEWHKFFNKISSSAKALFYLCTYTNSNDYENYSIAFDKIVLLFADEIVRCLCSNYNIVDYRNRVKHAKIRVNKVDNELVDR